MKAVMHFPMLSPLLDLSSGLDCVAMHCTKKAREIDAGSVWWWHWIVFVVVFVVVVARRYLQLHDPECLTSSSTPMEHAACFMAHVLGYEVLSLAHTASSARLSGHVSSWQSAHRPRPIRSSHKHFFPPLHWISSQDLASGRKKEKQNQNITRFYTDDDWTRGSCKNRKQMLCFGFTSHEAEGTSMPVI